MNPEYPVYVISKGRSNSCMTANHLEKMGIPYNLVIEPQEYKEYSLKISSEKILVLPFENLGQGSIPARNWVWEHSIGRGAERHWILDDNINGFERLNRNERNRVASGTIFRCAEDFVDRYENVALAGFEYRQFAGGARRKKTPFRMNTRIYSCILVKNDLTHRWRGKYNEDTDLSLRVLKDGWCTILFHCFLQNKMGTMKMKGGNTDTIYNTGDNRREFAESLQKQHADLVKVVFRYGRWHHDVNYDSFRKNKLIRKQGIEIPDLVNNYGMILVDYKRAILCGQH
jgi:hypothetical protein